MRKKGYNIHAEFRYFMDLGIPFDELGKYEEIYMKFIKSKDVNRLYLNQLAKKMFITGAFLCSQAKKEAINEPEQPK